MVKLDTHDKILSVLGSTIGRQLFLSVLPSSLYNVPILIPLINTITSHTILHVSLSNIVFTLTSLILLTKMRFLAKPRICNTPRSVPLLPSYNISQTFPCPIILFGESSPNMKYPPFNSSYS